MCSQCVCDTIQKQVEGTLSKKPSCFLLDLDAIPPKHQQYHEEGRQYNQTSEVTETLLFILRPLAMIFRLSSRPGESSTPSNRARSSAKPLLVLGQSQAGNPSAATRISAGILGPLAHIFDVDIEVAMSHRLATIWTRDFFLFFLPSRSHPLPCLVGCAALLQMPIRH